MVGLTPSQCCSQRTKNIVQVITGARQLLCQYNMQKQGQFLTYCKSLSLVLQKLLPSISLYCLTRRAANQECKHVHLLHHYSLMNKVSGEVVYLESKMKESNPRRGDSASGGRQTLKEHKAAVNSL